MQLMRSRIVMMKHVKETLGPEPWASFRRSMPTAERRGATPIDPPTNQPVGNIRDEGRVRAAPAIGPQTPTPSRLGRRHAPR